MKLFLKRDLTPHRAAAVAGINAATEAFRLKYLTPGSAQAMVYAEKSAEIERYRAALEQGAEINEADYPYALIDAELYGMTLDNGIAFLEFFGEQWRSLAPLTEKYRRAALVAVETAKSQQAIEKAAADLPALLAGIISQN